MQTGIWDHCGSQSYLHPLERYLTESQWINERTPSCLFFWISPSTCLSSPPEAFPDFLGLALWAPLSSYGTLSIYHHSIHIEGFIFRIVSHFSHSWTWVWVNSGNWWWTGMPGVLQAMGLQRVRHDWVTELNWTEELVVPSCLKTTGWGTFTTLGVVPTSLGEFVHVLWASLLVQRIKNPPAM